MFGSKTAGYFLGSVVISVCVHSFSLYNISVGADYVGNSGCKCHMGKGCFEGEEYKERLHSNTWEKRLKGSPDAENPDCLKCHATAYGEKIAEVGKKYLPNVQCEACHGAGSEYKKVKENYEGKGKDAFKEILKKDPFTARKVQYDTGLIVAGINGPATVKEQCMKCHWETKDDKNRCPKTDKVMDFKDFFKKDDHRDEDEIDVALKKLSPEDKKKWAAILPKDELLNSPLKPKKKE